MDRSQEFYIALVARSSDYEGIFFVGVRTTMVFCRPTCPARKPKFENCEFFPCAEQALLASYRPCKRCRPLDCPGRASDVVRTLVEHIEANPEHRWCNRDLAALSIDVSTAARHFQRRFNMTFVQYARARRLGLAMQEIRQGHAVVDAQLSSGYESGSGFRDAFSRLFGEVPSRGKSRQMLFAAWLSSPVGPMIAIADSEALLLLEFVDRRGLEREIERLRQRQGASIVPGRTPPIELIEQELVLYFEGKLTKFTTPIRMLGTSFQTEVWRALQQIPPGQTCSYGELAAAIGRPKACRAVARANGTNQLAIIIPCHRVIEASGALGGYGGGRARKEWLLKP